ncbi:MAG: phosphoenolpyruvate--protein phosphotransferase [SAR324 cluster bacterium]|nr:phosphoenolpyruvate--protein phosphotransferase [SAR324 cluster bacterium]
MIDSLPSNERFSVLKTLAEISRIITSSHDAYETLALTARMIAERMHVDACSIYIFDADDSALTLKATYGLSQDSVDSVKILPEEGLVGLVLELSEPVQVAEMRLHPRFKYFSQTREEQFSSFLGVPLIEHRKGIGVLVVHTIDCRNFTEEEEHILVTIASQIVGLISKAILIKKLDLSTDFSRQSSNPYRKETSQVKGTPIASGFALGKAIVLQEATLEEPVYQATQPIAKELKDFNDALERTITDILQLIDKVSEYLTPEEASILHVHLLFLEDRGFQEKIIRNIEQGASAAWSIYHTVQEHLRAFDAIDDPYLKEKGADLKDVGYRLLYQIGHAPSTITEKEGILISRQLLPSDVARLDTSKIKGLVMSSGGVVSHAAILARSLLIPAICVSDNVLLEIKEGEQLALDGKSGIIVINPGGEEITTFQRLLLEQQRYNEYLEKFRELPCQTKDGIRITVMANVGLQNDCQLLDHYGAEGIGLYRSEIYFLSLDSYPSIPQQVETYQKVLQSIGPEQSLIFRTLDLGADKSAPYMGFADEENPFLGFRALRRQLQNPEILKQQIKALLLTVGSRKNICLLFPMITDLRELQEAKQIYQDCRNELRNENYEPGELKIGMMFEVPGAILQSEWFMPEIDFCSIGSNDLTQYVLAVDRNNPLISHLYDPLHPSVLKMMYQLIQMAQKFNIPIEICGEMASDPDGCVILVGMGLTLLSMNAPLIPTIKARLSAVTLEDARGLARQAMDSSHPQDVRRMINDYFETHTVS